MAGPEGEYEVIPVGTVKPAYPFVHGVLPAPNGGFTFPALEKMTFAPGMPTMGTPPPAPAAAV